MRLGISQEDRPPACSGANFRPRARASGALPSALQKGHQGPAPGSPGVPAARAQRMLCPPWQLLAAAPDTVLRGSTKRASLTRIAWVRGWGDEPVPVVGVLGGVWVVLCLHRAGSTSGGSAAKPLGALCAPTQFCRHLSGYVAPVAR